MLTILMILSCVGCSNDLFTSSAQMKPSDAGADITDVVQDKQDVIDLITADAVIDSDTDVVKVCIHVETGIWTYTRTGLYPGKRTFSLTGTSYDGTMETGTSDTTGIWKLEPGRFILLTYDPVTDMFSGSGEVNFNVGCKGKG